MAYALVGAVGPVATGAAAPAQPAWGTGANRTAGNLLVCSVSVVVIVGTAQLVIPTTPSGWWRAVYGVGTGTPGNSPVCAIYYKIATGGDAAPIFSATAGNCFAQLFEFSGTVTNGSPLDQTGASVGVGTGNSKSWTAACPAADVAAGELVITADGLAMQSISGTLTTTQSMNNGSLTSVPAGGSLSNGRFGYGMTTSNAVPTVETAGWSASVNGNAVGATSVCATFLLPGGPPRLNPAAMAHARAGAIVTTSGTLALVGAAQATAATVNLPSGWQPGDLAVAYAYRNATTVAPTVPAGWNTISASAGANANARAVGWRALQAGDTSTGTWTNATAIAVTILRNQATVPIGASASGGTNNATLTQPALTLQVTNGTSWLLLFAGSKADDANMNTYANTYDMGSTVPALNCALQPNVASFAGANYVPGVDATQNRTDVIEILAGPIAAPPAGLPVPLLGIRTPRRPRVVVPSRGQF